jgi:hypothetical protein
MSKSAKRAYLTPELTSFGSVAQLTQGYRGSPGSGSGASGTGPTTIIVRRGYANAYGKGPRRGALPISRTGGGYHHHGGHHGH